MNRRGFSLVEVLAAAAIFVLTFAVFGQLLNAAARLSASTNKISHALYAARSQMEMLRRQPPAGELSVIRAEFRYDPRRPPIELISLKSRY